MTTQTGGHRQVTHRVTAVVPVKRLAVAKSRLAVPARERRELVLAFAVDTISAVRASPLVSGVIVVTSDASVAQRVRRLGARVVADDRAGLDAAVRVGVLAAAAWRPGTSVAVVPADLPCLRPHDVTQVLAGATSTAGTFVPDRAGSGTTLVVLPPGRSPVTRYGPGSAEGHRALGLQPLLDASVRARHDVDTLDDLEGAQTLGPGAETRAALEALDEPFLGWLADGSADISPRWRPTR